MEPPVVSDPLALASLVQERLPDRLPAIVGVDGHLGSGKSYLARQLASLIDGTHIEVDRYLAPQQGAYLPFLNLEELRQAVLAEGARQPVIVDGICLQEVFDLLGLRPDLTVYVRRISPAGLWHDEDLSAASPEAPDPEEVLQEYEDLAKVLEPDTGTEEHAHVSREVARYHREYRPVQRADILYDRRESDQPSAVD